MQTPANIIKLAVERFREMNKNTNIDLLHLESTALRSDDWHITLSYPKRGSIFERESEEYLIYT